LVPLLQIWLYASREAGCFEKRYEEICQFLNIRVYEHLSKIREKLGPSLDELKTYGYLSNWQVERTSGGAGFKIILFHGEKFHRDLQRRTTRRLESPHGLTGKEECATGSSGSGNSVDEQLLKAMTERGISVEVARALLTSLAKDQEVMDQLEWGDYLIAQSSGGKFRNPPGFYVHLVRANVAPPDRFETSRRRKLREAAEEARSRATQEDAKMQLAYMEYRKQEIDRHIASNFSDEVYSQAIQEKKREVRRTHPNASRLTEQQQKEWAVALLRKEIAGTMNSISFESFCEMNRSRENRERKAHSGLGG